MYKYNNLFNIRHYSCSVQFRQGGVLILKGERSIGEGRFFTVMSNLGFLEDEKPMTIVLQGT